ncbi:MAG: preprotein translocase subunit SecG [Clostridia bacterium]|nr:preprotein translocase subunit SecG [Clostridia bacterium]
MEIALGIVLIVMAVFLVVAVLMQQGKDKKLSGTIAGGADTYYGKGKGKSFDKILSRATTVVAILFGILVVAMYVIVAKLNG